MHDRPIAQRFRTGSNRGGYNFTGVTIEVAGTGSRLQRAQAFVELWSSSVAPGDHKRPQNRLLNLSNPSDLRENRTDAHELMFSAPAKTILAPDTNYWVAVNRRVPKGSEAEDFALQVERTTAAGACQEDADTFSGWNIAAETFWRLYGDAHGWIRFRNPGSMIFVVSGTEIINDNLGPLFQKAEVAGDSKWIFVHFDEPLDADRLPTTGRFTVTAAGESVRINKVGKLDAINGQHVVVLKLHKNDAIATGDGVLLSYDDPSNNQTNGVLQDVFGNDAADMDDKSVNDVGVSGSRAAGGLRVDLASGFRGPGRGRRES